MNDMTDMNDKPAFLANAARLTHAFFDRDTETVARELLGCLLVHRSDGVERIGRIVETEAYLGVEDLAAHSSKGITPRTRIMFGPAGYAYVYLIYGMHHCINVVTGPPGEGTAVLLRALEPVRNLPGKTSGPGLLCKAMGIDRRLNGHDFCSDDLHILARPDGYAAPVVHRPRIGVDYAGEWAARPLRFYLEGNSHVSRK
ncbi:DNA-3-methyladenine glycosylase [Noviherbaspirillum suwonense]|jgi:DNA-3-methyladenine glycosylase|uniref:Putative 3-methyladenine DNA glycosylase n=1 Tax=Noviherbaspirillum suwonense TaxID=1224511 RepID=A0ABY1QAV2_9BURK|nr:DNA-3-methyladenine glycosylase [Noviherbaspirillum suwonense]SMP64906.1 DNA-3-methyladenine glycosylase [Noviherbaspirillum suwonense]